MINNSAFCRLQRFREYCPAHYALMFSVLFLASRMRAIQLTQGETVKYKMP